jgi:hypothetical protein
VREREAAWWRRSMKQMDLTDFGTRYAAAWSSQNPTLLAWSIRSKRRDVTMENTKSRVTIHMVASLDGVSFFEDLDKDIALHLVEVKAYKTGMVALRYEVRR